MNSKAWLLVQSHLLKTGNWLGGPARTVPSVLASTWSAATQRLTLTLNVPLVRAIGGQDLQIVPGCDGEHQTCIDKFNNLDNFGGFPSVPDRNLSLKAIENRVTQGDKK